jgi:uncharacterized repeat protein (TIGR03803 family)
LLTLGFAAKIAYAEPDEADAVSPKFTVLHSFTGADGAYPGAALVQATNGDFYGTTVYGGANCAPNGCGTIFEITPSGALTTVYSFFSQAACTDGANPAAGLVQAANGDLYGTAQAGGANCVPNGCGTIFKITPSPAGARAPWVGRR